jgi:hypothetical protein
LQGYDKGVSCVNQFILLILAMIRMLLDVLPVDGRLCQPDQLE